MGIELEKNNNTPIDVAALWKRARKRMLGSKNDELNKLIAQDEWTLNLLQRPDYAISNDMKNQAAEILNKLLTEEILDENNKPTDSYKAKFYELIEFARVIGVAGRARKRLEIAEESMIFEIDKFNENIRSIHAITKKVLEDYLKKTHQKFEISTNLLKQLWKKEDFTSELLKQNIIGITFEDAEKYAVKCNAKCKKMGIISRNANYLAKKLTQTVEQTVKIVEADLLEHGGKLSSMDILSLQMLLIVCPFDEYGETNPQFFDAGFDLLKKYS